MSSLARQQAERAARLPGVVHALGMPDIHASNSGLPNGFVLGTNGTIFPKAIGGDICCGMTLFATGLHRNDLGDQDDVYALMRQAAAAVNLGHKTNTVQLAPADLERILAHGIAALPELSAATRNAHPVWDLLTTDYIVRQRDFMEHGGSLAGNVAAVPQAARRNGERQLGTVGEGNHFVELQRIHKVLDADAAAALGLQHSKITLMIHTGSRGLGHAVGDHYAQRARNLGLAAGQTTSVKDVYPLAINTAEGDAYLGAMQAAANFAYANRVVVSALVLLALREEFPHMDAKPVYDVAHNMVYTERHGEEELVVHRKGATRAFDAARMAGTRFTALGQPILIPGSMGTASYVALGQSGSTASLASVNHGSGRRLSRSEALGVRLTTEETWDDGAAERRMRTISDADFAKSMRGVALVTAEELMREQRTAKREKQHGSRDSGHREPHAPGGSGRSTIKGEAPGAYKDIHDVMDVVFTEGWATGVVELRPVGVLKE
ncbi:MAG: RtcB family protein [Deltaproteobacteria bacterium]|nr:RtcB family protein [Deltaproteobacteria bacterium]